MSWEKSTYEKTCYCGKGTIVVTIESDDWNRSKYSEEIRCPDCKIREDHKNALEIEKKREYQKLSKQVLDYFSESYTDIFMAYFIPFKSKKEVWEKAKFMGIESCSLNTFRKRVREDSIEKYLQSYIRLENLTKILDTFDIEDETFNSLIALPMKMHKEIKDQSLANYMKNL